MRGPFESLGKEFAGFAAYVGGEADTAVTVERVDPDTGIAVLTATGVQALKLSDTGQPLAAGGGGELGYTSCQFWLTGSQVAVDGVGFVPGTRTRVTESDGVTKWRVSSCERVGFGESGTLYRVAVTIEKG